MQRVWNYLSHDHCQVCGKLLQTPSERLWTWPKNQKKFLWFLLKRQKPGSNQSNIATFSDKKLTNFQSSLQTVWNYLSHEYCQVDGKTTQTPSERFWTWPKNEKKIMFFCWNGKSWGPIKVLLWRFPTKNSPTFNRHCKQYEITFHMNIVKLMAKQHKHHQNDIELDWKIEKSNVFLLKRQKLGSNQSSIATFSDKKLTNFQSSLQTVWNYLSHEYCQVDGKTTQTPSERYWTWPKNEKKIMFFC